MKKVIGLILLLVIAAVIYFTVKPYWKNPETEKQIAEETVEVPEPVVLTAKDLYPDLGFGDWLPVPPEDLDPEEELKYNGALISEEKNGDIITKYRVHNQKHLFFDSYADIFFYREGDETVTWVYDNPDDLNYLFSLETESYFDVLQYRCDFNTVTEVYSYWLKVSQNNMEGWMLIIKQNRAEPYLYEYEDLSIPVPVYFPYGTEKKLIHIRKLGAGVYIDYSVPIFNHPFYKDNSSKKIEKSNGKWAETGVRIAYMTAKEDIEETNGSVWLLLEHDDFHGWYPGSNGFYVNRGGPLYMDAESVIKYLFLMGA